MRRYPETRDTSSELLRLALPLISRQQAGFHPASYAVWYEYVASTNPALKLDIDSRLASGKMLVDDDIYALHDKFVAGPAVAATEKMGVALDRMLQELSGHAASVGNETQTYGASLTRFGDCLRPGADPQVLQAELGTMIETTRSMRDKTIELHEQLDGSAKEVEALRAELKRVKGESMTDALTGIANRRGLEHVFAAARAGAGGLTGYSLIMLDIDHFKKCNDTFGHLFGDRVLRSVAQMIAKNVKGQDTAARVGGEEFAVLLPDTPLEGACKLAERVRLVVASGRIKTGSEGTPVGNITISLGVAEYAAGETDEELMLRADNALYASKQGGRNRVTVAQLSASDAKGSAPDTRAREMATV